MSPVQHAYRRGCSCLLAWADLDTLDQDTRNRGKQAALLMTDQSAAFNLVKSSIIIAKLRNFWVEEMALKVVESYLTGRSTQCIFGKSTSGRVVLRSGVGEGSVVGPLYFVATLLDVTEPAKRVVRKVLRMYGVTLAIYLIAYADVVSALVVADTEAEIQIGVTEMMKELGEYFSSARLGMNPSKSELVVFRKGQQRQVLQVVGQEEATHAKLLGVTV